MTVLSSYSVHAEPKKPKVVVIGAGLAGLTSSYRLNQHGVDVHVYEARNRVGGRVFTVKLEDQIAELGLEIEEHKISLDISYYNSNASV